MAERDTETGLSGARTSRRAALKIGAAAGVGVAAWTGPQIGMLGASPAYAGVCSPGEEQCATTGKESVNWGNCDNAAGDDIAAINNALNTTSLSIGGGTVTLNLAGACSGAASVTVSAPPSGVVCKARYLVFLQSNPSTTLVDKIEVIPAGGGVFSIPEIVKPTGSAAYKWEVSVCCTTDPDDCDNLV